VLLVAEAKLGGGRSVSMEEEKMEEIERVFLGDGFTGFYFKEIQAINRLLLSSNQLEMIQIQKADS